MNELKREEWTDRGTGLQVLIVNRGFLAPYPVSWFCGYVSIPDEHPLRGMSTDDKPVFDLEVYGGVTFSGTIPGDSRWWVGFDTNHGEIKPRTIADVRADCRSLARQVLDLLRVKRWRG